MAAHETHKRSRAGRETTLARRRARSHKREHAAIDLDRLAREIGATVR